MNNIRKITAIILALLIFSALPMNAFAATPVENAAIDICSAIAGKTADDYEDFVSFTATGLQFEDEKYDFSIGYRGVWVGKEGGNFTGTFVEGDTYTFEIYLAATAGYEISADAASTVRIDGETVLAEDYEDFDIYNNDGYDCLYVKVNVTATSSSVNNIIIDIDSAIEGKVAADYEDFVSFTPNGLRFRDEKYGCVGYLSGVRTFEEEEYDNNGDLFTGRFVEGDTYTFEIHLAAKEGYSISDDAIVTVKIAGKTVLAENYENFGMLDLDGYDCLNVDVDVTVTDATTVNNIVIDIDSKISGKTADDYEDFVSFRANGLQFEDAKYDYDEYYRGVYISKEEDYDNNYGFDFTGEFVEGDTYTFEIYLAATEGYSIPEDATVTVRIDGETVLEEDYEYFEIFNDDGYDCLNVDVDVTATKAKPTPVNDIVIDINSRIEGKTANDYEKFVSFTANGLQFEDEKYGYEVGDKGVYISKEEDYDNSGYNFAGEFVEGDIYTFEIYLAAKEGYRIPWNATVTVRIDGETVLEEDYEYFELYNWNGYDCLNVDVDVTAKEPTPVNNIVIDIDSRIEGKTADDYEDFVSFTATGLQFEDGKYGYIEDYKGVWIYKEEEYDTDKNDFTGEFVGGDTYTFDIYLAATAGYSIPEDATVTVRIDGVTVLEEDYEYFDSYNDDGYDVLCVGVDVTAKEPTPVNDIVIDIDSTIAGKTPDDYEDFVSFTANGLQFKDEKNGYDEYDRGVYIFKEEDYDNYEDPFTGEFVGGDTYTFSVALAPKKGYFLPDEPTVTVKIDGVTVPEEDYENCFIFNIDGFNIHLNVAVDVNVKVPVTGVSLDITSKTLEVGATQQLVATVNPTDATNKDVTWESSDTAVATVDENGLVTAKSAGTATITVETVDGNKTDTCTITVNSGFFQKMISFFKNLFITIFGIFGC